MRANTRIVLQLSLVTLAGCSDPSPTSPALPAIHAAARPPQQTALPSTWRIPLDTTVLSLRGDGHFSDGTFSTYTHQACGVNAVIFAGGSGDAVMQTPVAEFKKKCSVYPRIVALRYPDGLLESGGVFFNLLQLEQNGVFTIPVGSSVQRHLNVNPAWTGRCDVLRFTAQTIDGVVAADSVRVTRIAANRWLVASQPDTIVGGAVVTRTRANCTTDGQSYDMRVRFESEQVTP